MTAARRDRARALRWTGPRRGGAPSQVGVILLLWLAARPLRPMIRSIANPTPTRSRDKPRNSGMSPPLSRWLTRNSCAAFCDKKVSLGVVTGVQASLKPRYDQISALIALARILAPTGAVAVCVGIGMVQLPVAWVVGRPPGALNINPR